MTLTTIKKPKKQKRWLFPEAIEREYVKYLQAIAKQISDTARKKLLEITPHLKKTLRQDDSIEILEQWLTELLQATTFYTRDNDIRPVVRQFLSQTAEFNKKQFHKVLKSAYKVDIFVSEPWLDEPLLQAEWQNINLIKSLPMQLQEKLRYRMAEAVLGGESYKSLAADLEKLLDIPKRRATIIARDQIGKLNGRLTQLRQENIGVKSYIWRGSLDERERLLHVEREGKVFRWDNPPDDGHPGQPILCRCSAEAVLPEFGELANQNNVIVTSENSLNLTGPQSVLRAQPISLITVELIDKLRSANVKFRPVQLLDEQLSTDSIIAKLAGGDRTRGSCASLALSYIGNRIGLDVTDYRGGASQKFFSFKANTRKLFSMSGIKTKVFDVAVEAEEVAELLKTELDLHKEYYLSTGKHAAIVRRGDSGLEYLELQSAVKNGWMSFERYGTVINTLEERFGCEVTEDGFIRKMVLAEVDSFKSRKSDLREILGYLNTATNKQRKGILGGEK
ncbi:phage minor head protein [Gallibacterium anatis]|uniref:phage head morphogenesis protein n=1 Tax=Gallibacterium anatis TaxID=750 RepID=UPI001E382B7A|nr:phage minor head protein [Gallibacterium anatis]